MLKGYAVNRNVVSEQKYKELKKAMGLLENVFSKELLLTSDQATDLFDVIRDYVLSRTNNAQIVKEWRCFYFFCYLCKNEHKHLI